MVNIIGTIGEFRSVRHSNNNAAPTKVKCRNAGAVGEGGQAEPAPATASPASIDGDARAVPPAVTDAFKGTT